jgi:hypothetical protein
MPATVFAGRLSNGIRAWTAANSVTVRSGGGANRVAALAENGLSQIQRERFVTIAIAETAEGINVVGASTPTVQASVRALMVDGEVAVSGIGHAERTAVEGARALGLTPTGVAASRGICPACANYLKDLGIEPLTPLR